MKYSYLVILLLIFYSKSINAQKYQPYDTNMVWKVFQTGNAAAFSNQCYRTDVYFYYVRNYIVNNGRFWHKVFANVIQGNFIHQTFGGNCDPSIIPVNSTQFIGMFSNDTLNKKVYFVPTWSLAPNFTPSNTNLIFDSNKNIGDVMSVFSGGDPSAPVLNYQINSIDSVLLGTKYHKRFVGTTTFWQNYSPTRAYFIEGVGASAGVFNSAFNSLYNQSSKLACFSGTNFSKYYIGQNSWNVGVPTYPSGLGDITVCFISLPSAINKNSDNEQTINIYPIPAKDKITLEFDNKKAEEFNLTISNSLGQKINSSARTINSRTEIDLSELPAGIYYLKIQNDSWQKTFKIIKDSAL